MKRMIAMVAILAAAMGCGDDDAPMTNDAGTTDSGTAAVDSGTPVQTDSGTPVQTDGGTMSSDPCAATDDFASTVGCNGDPVGPDAPANAFFGTCTPSDDPMMFRGSCTSERGLCAADEGATEGYCLELCEPSGMQYNTTTSTCPSGSRCFTLQADFAICFPDCRSAADCHEGQVCDDEGSCVDEEEPEMDAGTPDMDAGTPDMDAGAPEMDAGVPEVDAGE